MMAKAREDSMSTATYIEHMTTAGERWDLLAWVYYGDPTLYSSIVMANPSVPIEPVFEAGISILIPILQTSSVMTRDLPPWKTATIA
jgi:phage tail protein X